MKCMRGCCNLPDQPKSEAKYNQGLRYGWEKNGNKYTVSLAIPKVSDNHILESFMAIYDDKAKILTIEDRSKYNVSLITFRVNSRYLAENILLAFRSIEHYSDIC